MWIPGQALSQEIVKLFISALGNDEIKNELKKQIRTEIDTDRAKYRGKVQTYDSLTSGDVNTQARMAASGHDVYGKTIIDNNNSFTNGNVYQKMKNKIIYGKTPEQGYRNTGGRSIV